VLGSEAGVRKDILHGIAIAAHRPQPQPPFDRHQPSPVAAAVPPAAALASTAADAASPGNCSLKDVSRIAARGAERELIAKMLQQTRWNRKETAEILGISYKALLYKIKESGLDKAS
jgi:DNA-binding NtrC family response regulator